MQQDRQKFNKRILDNGIIVWSHKMDVPFAHIRVIVPVGTAHAHEGNSGGKHGISHFLEHMCGERSRLYPEKHSFEKILALGGGSWNACTDAFTTTFYMQAPVSDFSELLPGFMSHIFEPIFKDDDIELQKSIIMNEYAQKKFYPAEDESGKYKYTQWMRASLFTKEQVFGTESDIKSFSKDALTTFHSHYFLKGTEVIIGGTYDEEVLDSFLQTLKTHNKVLSEEYSCYAWERREFHTVQLHDTDNPVYNFGNLTSTFTRDDVFGVGFITTLLCDQQYGILNDWIRKEKGWSYGVGATMWFEKKQFGWTIDIPLNDEREVQYVRAELHNRIKMALSDTSLISATKSRLSKSICFNFQTLDDRITSASEQIMCFGSNFTEHEYLEWLNSKVDEEFLLEIYDKSFSPTNSGELLILPKT